MEEDYSREYYYKKLAKHMKVFNRDVDNALNRTSKYIDSIKDKVETLHTASGTYSLYSLDEFENSFILLKDSGSLKHATKVTACMHCSLKDMGRVLFLENICVRKENQGTGLGHRMIEFAKEWGQYRQCQNLNLEADQNYVFINGRYIHLTAYVYFVKHNMEFRFDKADDVLTYVYTGRIPFGYNLNNPTPSTDRVFGDKLLTKEDFDAYDIKQLINSNATKMRR